jgi:hypothetical protein
MEKFFEGIVKKTIWIYLPFYAIWKLTKDFWQEIFSKEK